MKNHQVARLNCFRRSHNGPHLPFKTMIEHNPVPDAAEGSEESPRVSVVMPVKDAERFLDAAITSARNQTITDIEILVVLNGSTDASEAIALQHASEDSRIRVLHCPTVGASPAMNWGVEAARSPWIARLDADDIWLPEKLERQLDVVDLHRDLGAVATFGEIISESGRAVARFSSGGPTSREEFEEMRDGSLIFLLSPSLMFSRQVSRHIGGHQVDLGTAAEDLDFWNRIADNHLILSVPELLVQYRVHTGSASSQRFLLQALNTRMIEFNMLRRRAGEGEIGIDEYKAIERSWPIRRKIRVGLRDRSRYYYRRGGALLANNEPLGAWWILLSFLLYPSAPFRKFRAQAMMSRVSDKSS